MTAPRPWRAGELAEALGAALEGDPELLLTDLRGLDEAGPSELSFLSNRRYLRKVAASRAGALLLDRRTAVPGSRTLLRLDDPYLSLIHI